MVQFTDEKLRQLAALADEQCPSQLPALIQQLKDNIDRLDELVSDISKHVGIYDKAVQS